VSERENLKNREESKFLDLEQANLIFEIPSKK
jgi:hypothetical protein